MLKDEELSSYHVMSFFSDSHILSRYLGFLVLWDYVLDL